MAGSSEAVLNINDCYKVFATGRGRKRKGVVALSNANLEVKRGEFVAFVGPSGCGKTTVLNMIAGSFQPTSGEVKHDGKRVEKLNIGIGYVTQDETLLPWRTLMDNVAFGLEIKGVPKAKREERAAEYIERVHLKGFERHYPHQLSGGMRKRAALIRTLVLEPDLILMDEPFGALDAQTRLVLQADLLQLWAGSDMTIIFVTHDLVESIALSDRVVTFARSPGRVKNIHPVPLPRPRDVYRIHEAPGYDEAYELIWRDVQDELSLTDEAEGLDVADGASVQSAR
jgi:NitT/TauT family transport system ATP-binding protein